MLFDLNQKEAAVVAAALMSYCLLNIKAAGDETEKRDAAAEEDAAAASLYQRLQGGYVNVYGEVMPSPLIKLRIIERVLL